MAAKTKAELQALAQVTADDWTDLCDSIEAGLKGDLLLQAGKVVKVNGTTVLGTQGAAIADLGAFTDPPSAGEMATLRTTVNALLARLRAHGIIAT